jgi:hypothetical protein
MDPEYAGYMARWRAMEMLGSSFNVQLSIVAIRARADIENAISTFAREPNGALIVFSSAITTANRESHRRLGRKTSAADDLAMTDILWDRYTRHVPAGPLPTPIVF